MLVSPLCSGEVTKYDKTYCTSSAGKHVGGISFVRGAEVLQDSAFKAPGTVRVLQIAGMPCSEAQIKSGQESEVFKMACVSSG